MSDTRHGTSQEEIADSTSVIEYCGRCDTRLVPNANFCHHCGAQILRTNTQPIVPPAPKEPRIEPRAPEMDQAPGRGGEEQQPDETTLWSGRPSKRTILVGLFRGAILGGIGVAAYRWIAARQNWPSIPDAELVAGGIIALTALLFGLRPLLRVAGRRYVITQQSIWVEEGVLRNSTSRYPLTGWRNIHVHQSLLQRLVGTGDIELEPTNLIEPPLLLEDIENVHTVARTLDRAIAPARKRGKHHSHHSQHAVAQSS